MYLVLGIIVFFLQEFQLDFKNSLLCHISTTLPKMKQKLIKIDLQFLSFSDFGIHTPSHSHPFLYLPLTPYFVLDSIKSLDMTILKWNKFNKYLKFVQKSLKKKSYLEVKFSYIVIILSIKFIFIYFN